ncbi:hypothetical protein [Rhodoferax sp.]|uniref:hypothetical protein n=1 Tax=Rhodoferax sp. TaxID=50421 RepID=UPI00374DE997
MTSQIKCNICKEISGFGAEECGKDYQELVALGENLIILGKHFAVIPSVGPLSNTHVMLVPLTHVNSFAELSTAALEEASLLLEKLQLHVKQKIGRSLFFFESGAGELTDHSGGCITHAHIHCIAESIDFYDRLSREVLLKPVGRMDFSNADKKHGYIWFMSSTGEAYICNNPLLPSQFLRYIYAQSTKIPSIWNWRRHTNFPSIKEVLNIYHGIN